MLESKLSPYWELSLVKGIGPSTLSKLLQAGITTIQQLASADPQFLRSQGIRGAPALIKSAAQALELPQLSYRIQDLLLNSRLQLKQLQILRRRLIKLGRRKSLETQSLAQQLEQIELELNRAKYLEQKLEQLSQRSFELEQQLRAMEQKLAKEIQLQIQLTKESMILDLIPALDGFQDALRYLEQNAPPEVVKGVRMIQVQLEKALELHGLIKIQAKPLEQHYDPAQHQALEFQPSDQYPEGTILEQYRAGYKLGPKVIRPALVKVAKKG